MSGSSPLNAIVLSAPAAGDDPAMIMLDGFPKNQDHFVRLIRFLTRVLKICARLGIDPVVNGSLAVFAYTHNHDLDVNDVDLAISEADFERLRAALEADGISCRLREWHVLQVESGDLKIDFDSIEYWQQDLPLERDTLKLDTVTVSLVSLPAAKTLYRRGLAATARQPEDGNNRRKHASYQAKYAALNTVDEAIK